MNDKCKYCDYVSKCSRICEYDSYLCKVHRSFPKVVDKSYEQLQQENKILKENAEHNDKVVDKVNWENVLLKKENEQLKEELKYSIGIVEHNRIISEKNKETHQLKDNWTKLKEYIRKNIIYDDIGMKILDPSPLEDYMQKLEQRSDSNEKISKITR